MTTGIRICDADRPSVDYAASVDRILRALVTVDEIHHNIHDGIMFRGDNLIVDLDAAQTADTLFVTGPDVVHTRWRFASSVQALITAFEGVVTSSNGVVIPIFNYNRNSSKMTSVTMFSAPTVTNTGTQLSVLLSIGGTGAQAVGNESLSLEWILKANTKYLIRVLNNTAQNNEDFQISSIFYQPNLR